MADNGKILPPDSDAPTAYGVGHDHASGSWAAVGAQTPPPISAVTSAQGQASGAAPGSDSALRLAQLFPPGTVLGSRYEILRVLGEGGMGAVYQARDKELDRIIALKVIRPELAGNPAILQRFKQELILARHITHKNVVRIYDLGEADGIKFITMEYVDGDDLRTLLKRDGKCTPLQAVHIIEQVCRALSAAHAEGVIHRDLKPQNIMRDRHGRIVVMDFGLARSLEEPGMTQTGALVGTLEYMSPEQALGAPLDQRSDIFAVGLIFYELLTGKTPYKADTALASLMKRTREHARPASEVDNSVPKPLSAVVSRCLERDMAVRYHTADEILAQLQVWQSNPHISAGALSRMMPAPSRSLQISLALPQRRIWLWAAGAVLVLGLLLAVPTTRNFVFHAKPASETSNPGVPELAKGKYVAVLPFRVIGDEHSLGYVADGLGDALSAKLFQLQEVHVASSSAVEKVASQGLPMGKLARALGVNLILQGTVQGSTDRLRVTLDLEDLSSGKRVWTQEFSGVAQDLLTMEDRVYGELVNALALKPTTEEMARTGSHPTENITAYDLYLQGRNAMHGSRNVQSLQAAIRFFEDALHNDSNFALAYTGLADADLAMYKESKDTLWAQKALAAAHEAERINSSLAEVHLALGSVYSASGRSAEAVEQLKRALTIAPNSDEAYRRLGDAYRAGGKKQEALVAYQNAVLANPYYWYNHNTLGGAYFHFGQSEEALQEYRKVIEMVPENATGYVNTGAVYFRLGKWTEAVPAFQKALEIQPDADIYSNLGTCFYFVGRYDDSLKMFEKAVELSPKSEQLMGNLADAYRSSGQSQRAAATYDKAIMLAYEALQVNPRSAETMGDLALYYAKKGDKEHALQYIRQARSIQPSEVQVMYWEAQVNALAGNTAEALKALHNAFEKGYSPEEAQNDPELRSLQGLPEFTSLVREFTKKRN